MKSRIAKYLVSATALTAAALAAVPAYAGAIAICVGSVCVIITW